jgi:hypothetical protein
VAATSTRSAWAVGTDGDSTLIMHWNGTSWARVPSPSPGTTENFLGGVAAASAGNVWAVGDSFSVGGVPQTLAMHCC